MLVVLTCNAQHRSIGRIQLQYAERFIFGPFGQTLTIHHFVLLLWIWPTKLYKHAMIMMMLLLLLMMRCGVVDDCLFQVHTHKAQQLRQCNRVGGGTTDGDCIHRAIVPFQHKTGQTVQTVHVHTSCVHWNKSNLALAVVRRSRDCRRMHITPRDAVDGVWDDDDVDGG